MLDHVIFSYHFCMRIILQEDSLDSLMNTKLLHQHNKQSTLLKQISGSIVRHLSVLMKLPISSASKFLGILVSNCSFMLQLKGLSKFVRSHRHSWP